jgi:hypothetical protein
MMEDIKQGALKNSIIEKFSKVNSVEDLELDPLIKQFIIDLNGRKHISTHNSCEGHTENDKAYLSFCVDSEGWEKFWSSIAPQLSFKLRIPLFNNIHIFYINWSIATIDDKYSARISISAKLNGLAGSTVPILSWEEVKLAFWKILEEEFLLYFNESEDEK